MSFRRSTRLNTNAAVDVGSSNRSSSCDLARKRQSQRIRQQHSDNNQHDDDVKHIEAIAIAALDNKENIHMSKEIATDKKILDAQQLKMLQTKKTNKRKVASHAATQVASAEEEQTHKSPPKQARANNVHAKTLSPSSLLVGLSIKEAGRRGASSSDEEQEQDEQQQLRSQLEIARSVLNNAETQQLIGREAQLQELSEYLLNAIDTKTASSIYISGQPGTGKTACLTMLLRRAEIAKRSRCVFINCTSVPGVLGVFKKICAELNIVPEARNEAAYIKAIQQYLVKAPKMVLLVLDEVDQLCTFKHKVLYTIFEWPALKHAQLLLVAIANNLDLTERVLPRLNARKQLKPVLMHFPPYDRQQIVNILRARLEEANVLDVFPAVTLQLLAAKVSAVNGDIRRALDIGRRVVESAAEQQKQQPAATRQDANLNDKVKPAQVAQVLNKVYGGSENLNNDADDTMPLQQKLMLCSLLLMRRHEPNKDATMARLFEVYRQICRKRNMPATEQTEFANLIELIETRGILRIIRKKEPRHNKVQLQWDEDEVTAALKDMNLISTIIQDKSYLS